LVIETPNLKRNSALPDRFGKNTGGPHKVLMGEKIKVMQ
jgi:hypothetical protein